MAALRTLLKPNEAVKLYAISIDPPEVSKDFAQKLASDGHGAINYPILSDAGSKTIDAYGIRDPTYAGQQFDGIPHPAVFVIDQMGKVAWARVESGYRERPANDLIRNALNALAPKTAPSAGP